MNSRTETTMAASSASLAYQKGARIDVLAAVIMNTTVFWNVKPYVLIEVYLGFGGTYYLQLQVIIS